MDGVDVWNEERIVDAIASKVPFLIAMLDGSVEKPALEMPHGSALPFLLGLVHSLERTADLVCSPTGGNVTNDTFVAMRDRQTVARARGAV